MGDVGIAMIGSAIGIGIALAIVTFALRGTNPMELEDND